ncbi:DUF262 domain-containing protein [Acetivibrio saccincola]|jgi:hypothetical protein|uniref:DUF262 domain-containing protein n=1 Tax=Acetivibrio saccincola TaxID=1677857 RepID=UPI001693819E|nr:DUF262 domain-containing protein [Acetivibrio saccincola]NLW28031.1 DUF262 domain-containing protein [Acetivibrio saccincola]
MANWTNLSVKETIRKIKDEEIVLPVIQRRLVWSEEQIELLFDSLLKGNSFGAIICIEEEKDNRPLFAYRVFSRDGNNVASIEVETLSKTQWFIIDGQQRLQSFYIGLTGTLNGKRLYFDLLSDYINSEYDFKFAINNDELPKNNKERDNTNNTVSDCLWWTVDNLFQRLSTTNKAREVAKEIIKKANIDDSIKIDIIETNVQDFFDAVFAYESVGISKVSINKDKNALENRQRIVELFRRLNDGGTKLSAYDLVASMFKGFDYKMEQFLDTVVAENADIGLKQDDFIKLLLILNDKPSKEMSDLTPEDAEFATSNFNRIQASLKALKNFLIVTSNYNWFSSSKNRSAIPLYFITYHIFYSKTSTDQLSDIFSRFDTTDKSCQDMAVWLRLSILNKVFSRGCGWIPYKTGIRKIHAVMKENKGRSFPKDSLFTVYNYHPLYFYDKVNENNLNFFDQEYMLYLIYNGQPTVRSEDIDHIHPYSLLKRAGVDESRINNIANYQLLDSGTNRGIKNGKELADWIQNCIDNSIQKGYLERHLIPRDKSLWKTENYDQFFVERSKLIAAKLNTYL